MGISAVGIVSVAVTTPMSLRHLQSLRPIRPLRSYDPPPSTLIVATCIGCVVGVVSTTPTILTPRDRGDHRGRHVVHCWYTVALLRTQWIYRADRSPAAAGPFWRNISAVFKGDRPKSSRKKDRWAPTTLLVINAVALVENAGGVLVEHGYTKCVRSYATLR